MELVLLCILLGVVIFGIGRVLIRAVLHPSMGIPLCGGCGARIERQAKGLTSCDVCGQGLLAVGILKGRPAGQVISTKWNIGWLLALLLAGIAVLAGIPLWSWWPNEGLHVTGGLRYQPAMFPSNRVITTQHDMMCIRGQPVRDGNVEITVDGPVGGEIGLQISLPDLEVLRADPAVVKLAGQKLPVDAVRQLYNAAGLDTTQDAAYAAEADALQGELLSPAGDPASQEFESISLPRDVSIPTLAGGGGGRAWSVGPVVAIGRWLVPLWMPYGMVMAMVYLVVLWRLLKVRERAMRRLKRRL